MKTLELTKDEHELLLDLLDYINEAEDGEDEILGSIIDKLENEKE
jgi:hypothetical protein